MTTCYHWLFCPKSGYHVALLLEREKNEASYQNAFRQGSVILRNVFFFFKWKNKWGHCTKRCLETIRGTSSHTTRQGTLVQSSQLAEPSWTNPWHTECNVEACPTTMSRFGPAVRRWAGKQRGLCSVPLRLSLLCKSCGLWTPSCDFVCPSHLMKH